MFVGGDKMNNKKNVHIGISFMMGASFVAYAIGGGFSTGNEILQYFCAWEGYAPIVVLILSMIVVTWTNYLTYRISYEEQLPETKDVFYLIGGKYAAIAFDWYTYICLAALALVMISGGGATLHQYFGINTTVGLIIFAIVAAITGCLGLRKLIDVLGGVGVVIIASLLFVGIYMLCTADVGVFEANKNVGQYVEEGLVLQAGFYKILNPVAAGLSQGGMAFASFIPFLIVQGKSLPSRKDVGLTTFFSSLLYYIPIIMVMCTLMLNMDVIAGAQVPILAAIQAHMPKFAMFYSLVICLGIYTTVSGELFLLGDRFAPNNKKRHIIIIMAIVVVAVVCGSFVPFATLMNIVFTVCGIFGILYAVICTVRYFAIRKRWDLSKEPERTNIETGEKE